MLTAEDIWAAQDIEERTVYVPQWHGSVRIRTFTKLQFDGIRKKSMIKDRLGKETPDQELLEAHLFCEGMIEPVIPIVDYDKVQAKSAAAVAVVVKAIVESSGLSDVAVSEADKSAKNGSSETLRVLLGARTKNDTGGTLATDVNP
jgi:hypothetical protein